MASTGSRLLGRRHYTSFPTPSFILPSLVAQLREPSRRGNLLLPQGHKPGIANTDRIQRPCSKNSGKKISSLLRPYPKNLKEVCKKSKSDRGVFLPAFVICVFYVVQTYLLTYLLIFSSFFFLFFFPFSFSSQDVRPNARSLGFGTASPKRSCRSCLGSCQTRKKT